jgi:hypothetical protein
VFDASIFDALPLLPTAWQSCRIRQPVDEELRHRRGPEWPMEVQQNAGPIKLRLKNESSN